MSAERRYVRVRYPWRATVDKGSAGPAAFYATLIERSLRSGRRSRSRLAPLWRLAARAPVPRAAVATSLKALPARPRPELDRLLEDIRAAWPELAAPAPALPTAAPELHALALERSAGLTVFVFGEAGEPLLVAKLPAPERRERTAREARALAEAEPAGVAPRPLGEVGGAFVQEALPGGPLPLHPLAPDAAATLRWGDDHAQLADALARLASASAKQGPPQELGEPVRHSLEQGGLAERERRLLAAAWEDVSTLEASVLRHRDISAENCLFDDGRLSGIIDWEHAEPRGAPGFDVLNFALAYLEACVGLARWSEERAVAAFESSWRDSHFWKGTRAAARAAATAAGVPDDRLDALELVFFGSRLGDRLWRPRVEYPTGLETVRRQFELVCAS